MWLPCSSPSKGFPFHLAQWNTAPWSQQKGLVNFRNLTSCFIQFIPALAFLLFHQNAPLYLNVVALVLSFFFFFNLNFFFFLFLYFSCVPHPEPSSLLPPHTIPLGHPSAPAPSIQHRALNLDWHTFYLLAIYFFLQIFTWLVPLLPAMLPPQGDPPWSG